MLGTDMCRVLSEKNLPYIPLSSSRLDITDNAMVHTVLARYKGIKALINCAAYTKVDDAETETEKAFRVNGTALLNLSAWAKKNNTPLIHFSTDYIFDGTKPAPYLEHDVPSPVNRYGRSKLAGEQAIVSMAPPFYIFRIQWLFGKAGKHFIATMAKLVREKKELTVVNDQWGSPSWSYDIARCVITAFENGLPPGIYNLANQGVTTWFDYAGRIRDYFKSDCVITPTTSDRYPRPARRPLNSRLDCNKFIATTGIRPLSWQDAVYHFLEEDTHVS